tara:strand:- start:54 stop:596 length:543 start_codon:yes stop_codon:yes gene_type:complete
MSQIKVNSIIPVSGVPTGGGGGIIQVKQTQVLTSSSTTSQSFGDTALVATITPTSATSKILCMVKLQLGGAHPSSAIFKLVRVSSGGTSENIAYSTESTNQPGFYQTYMNESGAGMGIYGLITVGVDSLDTAIDANEHTYKVQWRRHQGTIYLNRTGYSTTTTDYAGTGCSTITLIEVSA